MTINIKLPLINLASGNEQIKNSLDYELIDKMLEELKWYKKQDLIQRKDVINPIRYCHGDNIANCRGRKCSECYQEEIMKIPKAEPKYCGCSHDMFCEKTDCKGCEAEPKENKQ